MLRSRSTIAVSTCVAATTLLLVGCRPEEQIAQYTIPKPDSIQLPAENAAKSAPTASRPERMLGAILPGGGQVWFFKVSGPVDPVAARWDEFREFVKSVHFGPDGNPDWTLPKDWSRQPGTNIRYATLIIPDDPPLELSVTALPAGDGSATEQSLANINRWRGQLSLPPITEDQLATESETLPTTAGPIATVVNLVGTAKAGGMMSGPFARGGGIPTAPPQAAPTTAAVTYDTPSGWTPGQAGGMRKAAFEVRDGDHRAEVTVIDLSRDVGGDRLANVNRWRGQVKLPPISADELKTALKPIPVGSLTGDSVELIGDAAGQSILGVLVDRDDKTWFVKLQGPTPLVVSQRPQFEAFVKSLKFE